MVSELKQKFDDYWTDRVPGMIKYARYVLDYDTDFNHSLRVFLKDVPLDSKIIDMGTGVGLVALEVARMGFKVDAMDCNIKSIEAGIQLSREMGLDIGFMVGDVEDPELPERSYDVVIARNCVWNLENPLGAYQKWKRLLRPGG